MASVKSAAMMLLGMLLLASAASAARVLKEEGNDADASPRMIFLDDGSEVPAGVQPIILDDSPVDMAALSQSNRKLRTLGLIGGLIQYKLGLLQTVFGPRYVLVPYANAAATANADGSASSAASAGFQVVQQPGLFGGGLFGGRQYFG